MDNVESLFEALMKDPFSLIRVGQEEHLFLDFKEKSRDKPGLDKDDRRNYARALSGFSNAAGGTIVWGVRARKESEESADVVTELRPIAPLDRFLGGLNELTSQAIVPLNTGVRNEGIQAEGETNRGYVVTYVPASDLPPHRALLGVDQYYTRTGDSFVIMEHHMLADAFGRRRRPALRLAVQVYPVSADRDPFSPGVLVSLMNIGKYVALYPAITIDLSGSWSVDRFGIDGNGNLNLMPVAQAFAEHRVKFVGGANYVIHPTARLDVCRLDMGRLSNGLSKKLPRVRPELKKEDFLEFRFVIYAQDCEPVQGLFRLDSDTFYDLLDAEPPGRTIVVPVRAEDHEGGGT